MIRRLPRDVVDRIAAGEVVERPSSVVKELVENALDAGARTLDVTVDGGGLQLIRVADDGGGVPPEDVPLAFEPHATSKLHDVDDLAHIASFGFRGEALASIAAVARCALTSRGPQALTGLCVEAAAGRLGSPQAAACAPGTVVEVRDLFFNVPARRAFLASPAAETARCREVLAHLGLAHPGLRVTFHSDGATRLLAEGAPALRARAAAVFGAEFAGELLPVAARGEGLSVEGLLSPPAAARARPRCQVLTLNGRLVRDRGVAAAVRVGCQDFLPGSLQPSWILALTIDPARVDVNVHPTKAEVRFLDADAVFRLVRAACRSALLAADLAPRVRAEDVLPAALSAVAEAPAAGGVPRAPASPQTSLPAAPAAPVLPGTAGLRPAARFLQVLDTYIAHDAPDGLVLVDQHALHERILYARLQRQLGEGRVESQRLLLPEPVRLPPQQHARALELADDLARLGLHVEAFGPDTLAVRAVPAVLRGESPGELLAALVEPADAHGGVPHGLDRRLFTMACHAAVKAGDPLDEAEIESLLRQGAELEHDATCPHGRPTRVLIGRAELERLFKRTGF
ncbi:MAG TPA: DNA mismatch repair endonuclease MutL [Planctomycetota bacterium]|nr:DNA mismatch repair endonuclease MutL [Planctomycetota bacterium]